MGNLRENPQHNLGDPALTCTSHFTPKIFLPSLTDHVKFYPHNCPDLSNKNYLNFTPKMSPTNNLIFTSKSSFSALKITLSPQDSHTWEKGEEKLQYSRDFFSSNILITGQRSCYVNIYLYNKSVKL